MFALYVKTRFFGFIRNNLRVEIFEPLIPVKQATEYLDALLLYKSCPEFILNPEQDGSFSLSHSCGSR